MNAIRSIISMSSRKLPTRLKLVLSRFGSLILLFQRTPVVQFFFPEAGVLGGASMANSFSLAVTTVVGLGAYDSVAGATTIDSVQPLVVTGATSSRTSTTNAINVPATVSAALNFEFKCINAPSDPKSWRIVTSSNAATTLPTGLTMTRTSSVPSGVENNFITGTPAAAGTHLVYVRVYEDPNYAGAGVTQLFNICALGFSTQPAATTTINSGQTTTLTCVATGVPVATTKHNVTPTVTYQWYQGTPPTMTTPVGTTNSSTPGFTTPALTSSTNYWVRVKSVLGTSTVYANSNTAAVTVNPADTTPPTVTINQASGQADPAKASPINFAVVFSEPVTNFATGDVTVSGTAGGTKTATVTGSGTTYNVAVSGMTTGGTVIASLASAVASDAAGNPSAASTSTDATVTFDNTAPTVTINQVAGQADPAKASPINFAVVFSEPVTNFATGDVTVSGTAGGTKTATVTGSGTTYNVAVSGMTTGGTVIASLASAVASDAAGNASAASTSTDATVTFDNTAPTVTINQASGQTDPTTASPVNFTVLFSESVTNFATGDVMIGGTAGGTKTATVTGSGTTYNVAVSGMTTGGTVIASLASGVASDAAGNANAASTSTDATVTFNVDPYTNWASGLPADKRGATQTPQNDGITNLMKYACNLNPLAADVSKLTAGGTGQTKGLPVQSIVGGKVRMEFLRRKAATNPGITYIMQFSPSLDAASWSSLDVSTTPAGTSINAEWERVTVDDPVGGGVRFGRLKVTQP